MKITPEFLYNEINGIRQEADKARTVLIKCEGLIDAYTMLITMLEHPDETLDVSEAQEDPR